MYERDGEWVMEGLDAHDPKRIKNMDELYEYVDTVGFLPLFRSHVDRFSLEELTASAAWWSGTDEDPWLWREIASASGKVVYGKFFGGKAGFISREWFPYFASYRRDGYDFDTLYETGMATRKGKLLMDVLDAHGEAGIPSYQLKKLAGFSSGGERGFSGAITSLMMQTYVVICGFERRLNRAGEEYGWPVTNYCTAEARFGKEHVRSQYGLTREEALEKLLAQLRRLYPDAGEQALRKQL
ncbi:MAG: hypothetical protein J1E00_08550 [Oscillospiraceae bacterium]|nr:hypothetical protein [Oscillospiraceae bacterium]